MSEKHDIQNKLYKQHKLIHQATNAEIAKITKEKYPAWHVGQYIHKNTRGDSMNFVDVDYLLRLYKSIDKEPYQVVIKSVQCFPENTQIMTKTGFKHIQDITINDYVVTHKGRFRKVNHTFKRKVNENLVRLRSDVGEPVLSTQAHPFRVLDSNKQQGVWVDSLKIKKGDFVVCAQSVDLGSHKACRVKEHTLVNYEGYVYNFGVEEDESYVANGYVVHNCGLSELYIIQSHIEAGERGMTVMYVLPKYEIRNRFVNNRIYKLHKKVPEYAKRVQEADTKVHRTSLMHYGKGTIAYVGSNVEDEFIEIPVDSAYVDELDRCDLSNLLMLPDRLTASPYKYHREISNPTVEGFGIDERYNDSSKGVWMLRCPRCNKLFTPDFYKHVVRQVGEHKFVARDTDYILGESMQDARLIHDCGGVVDRLQDGEWVHENSRKKWKGYRISKVFSKFTSLSDLIEKHDKALGNDRKIQVFMNSDLGLAYTSEGAQITRNALNKCKREYAYPLPKSDKMNARFFGVDVGNVLHVIIRERIRVGDGWALRLIHALTVPGFSQLAQLLDEWRPKTCVIDSMPEIHKVADLKADYKNVWSSRFQEKLAELTKHKHIRELRMDRTSLLDEVKQGLELERLLLPMNAEFIDNGSYYEHMLSSTRILEANETNPEKSMYRWRHSKPDHYFLAEGYCLQASMMSPHSSIWDFYTQSSEAMGGEKEDTLIPVTGINNKKELSEMIDLTPETFLAGVQKKMNRSTQVRPKVDIKAIQRACENMHKAQGYVDLDLIVNQVGEHEGDVRRVLLQLNFGESKISGQYVK